LDSISVFENIVVLDRKEGESWEAAFFRHVQWINQYSDRPLRNLLKMMENRCTSIVIEQEYVDSDYLDAYSNYYSQLFADYEGKCWRLHFFAEEVRDYNLVNLSALAGSYLGFCVLRPTLSFQVSRTVLASPYDGSGSSYILCKADFEVNLSGNQLKIKGAPYCQQDTNVNVCAQASIWMSSLYMHKQFQTSRYLPSQINDLLRRCLSLGPVREGLYPFQIAIALREMGFEPHVFPVGPHDNPYATAEIVYGYVESEIPVILGLKTARGEGHAVTVVGHDYTTRHSLGVDWDSNINWIENFYINDDAQGPYLQLGIDKISTGSYHSGYTVKENVKSIIIPAPKETKMRLDDVLSHIRVLMSDKNILNDLLNLWSDDGELLFQDDDFKGLVFRTYLTKSNNFKVNLPDTEDYATVRVLCRSIRMPKYVWVTEISKADLINQSNPADRRRLGIIVFDSTADRYSYLASYLIIHFRQRFILKKAGTEQLFCVYRTTDLPCQHLVRS